MTMGCVGSKTATDINDKHPNVFRVVNVNHDDLWSGQLEVTSTNLTLFRKRKPPTQWPLQCLRRYGYEQDTFIFEAGRRCHTGEGIYSFRCRRADALFNLLQEYIQESTYNNNNNNNNNNLTVTSQDEVQQAQERMDADVAELRRGLLHHQTSGSNYIILHGNNSSGGGGGTLSQQASPINGATSVTGGNSPNRQTACSTSSSPRQQQQLQLERRTTIDNYLEPLEVGVSQVASNNPSNSNIYTNSIMIPSPGNVYQQLALAQSSPAAGSTKQSDTVESSPVGTPGSSSTGCSRPTLLSGSQSLMRIRSIEEPNTPSDDLSLAAASMNTYMNVTPGEMALMANSTTSSISGTLPTINGGGGSTANWRFSRMNSNASATTTAITERCYENLDHAAVGQLVNSTSSHVIVANGRAGRHSRPDIFSKVDLPMLNSNCGDGTGGTLATAAAALRMSEPCTPTGATQRNINYVVLNLDNQSASSSSASGNVTGGGGANGGVAVGVPVTNVLGSTTIGGGGGGASIGSLLAPDSPQQRAGYATIDFNKTVALSNSTNPTCESEASRKTRF